LDELHGEIKAADDRAKKALLDTSRIADELRSEQEHSAQIEKIRKSLEIHVKELTIRVEEAESSGIKGGKKAIAKLEQRV
jgi:hypothetical protein